MLPSRIDVRLKDGRHAVVLDADPKSRMVECHFGTYTQGGQERRVIEWVGCLELAEVLGWGVSGSAVTRLSTVTSKKRTAQHGTSNGRTSSPRSRRSTSANGADTGTSGIAPTGEGTDDSTGTDERT